MTEGLDTVAPQPHTEEQEALVALTGREAQAALQTAAAVRAARVVVEGLAAARQEMDHPEIARQVALAAQITQLQLRAVREQPRLCYARLAQETVTALPEAEAARQRPDRMGAQEVLARSGTAHTVRAVVEARAEALLEVREMAAQAVATEGAEVPVGIGVAAQESGGLGARELWSSPTRRRDKFPCSTWFDGG